MTAASEQHPRPRAGWGFILLVLLLAGSIFLSGCIGRREVKLSGRTMGTTYHITVIGTPFTAAAPLQKAIDGRLAAIEASMSTYRPDSEISRFNQLQAVDRPFPIGRDFQNVMAISQSLYRMTGGAWDASVDPLVDLWGFGRTNRPHDRVPADAAIQRLLPTVGFRLIEVRSDGHLSKRHPLVTIDLASVAKGYAVDVVAALLAEKGYHDYLVEIGGEIYAAGVRIDGQAWRIGINKPEAGAPFDQVYHVVPLSNRAFATSGDYRNFFEIEGRRYAHVIDPRTGYPVSNGIVSVSVTAETCALADGLATALMVLGVAEGIARVDRLEGVECLIITRDEHGGLQDHASSGFRTTG